MNDRINLAFMKLSKRAEGIERGTLIETFADVGPLAMLLRSHDHQIIYGRRGTGKTHALNYLAGTVSPDSGFAIYVDMRTIGSTGGLYSDPQVSLAERATRLLMDTLAAFHEGMLEHILNSADINLTEAGSVMDRFAEAVTEVTVAGPVETEVTRKQSDKQTSGSDVKGGFAKGLTSSLAFSAADELTAEAGDSIRRSGLPQHRVHFGRVGQVLQALIATLGSRRVWLLLDEWSSVPFDLQPYLADLLRRSAFPIRGITVKIAAIEQRTNLQLIGPRGDYIGIEIGADASANLNLDDFMVFENDPARATHFFQELLFKHFASVAVEPEIRSAHRLIGMAFTQRNTFEEFVRAAEGVPRDAINILSLAAQRAGGNPIAVENVRAAARSWYVRDKEAAVAANRNAQALLNWIIDEVIAHRRARAFLLRSGTQHDLIDALFDARVLHLLKRSMSTHDQPGARYDAYKIDYGCYVDLLATAKAPLGLLPSESTDATVVYADVPPDDYRAVRRAILDFETFEEALG
jgi:energy-coupling factor transporter ATP-binding protein EcfA2